ncbi:MAG: hypothetical protein M1296_01015 [Chloroflexi bacterium]|nr:hypothetical protein [Chloroflexota bacterium]
MQTLVLLVGENPLPNWVTLQALTEVEELKDYRPDQVVLLHSPKTKTIAERLQALDKKCRQESVPEIRLVDVGAAREPEMIYQAVKRLRLVDEVDGTLHLNYTGGTKAMSVTAALTLQQQLAGKRSVQYLISYLDTDSYCLRILTQDGLRKHTTEDLRSVIHMNLDDLLQLHGLRAGPKSKHKHIADDPEAREKVKRFASELLALDEPAWPSWQDYADVLKDALVPRRKQRREGRLGESEVKEKKTHLAEDEPVPLPEEGAVQHLRPSLLDVLGFPPDIVDPTLSQLYSLFCPQNRDHKKKIDEEVANFVDGVWLEYFIEAEVYAPHSGWHPHWHVTRSLHALPEQEQSGQRPVDFETDVLVLAGYQLIVLSCTTEQEDRSLLKSKGFEVLHRARQLGGGETRAILVCLENENSCRDLESDLNGALFSGADRPPLRVWGKREVQEFASYWQQYLRELGLNV